MAKSKTIVQKNGFPSELNGHNLGKILLWTLPVLILTQVPGFIAFSKCVDAHKSCNGQIGLASLALYFVAPPLILLTIKWKRHIPWNEIGFGKLKTSVKQTAALMGGGIALILGVDMLINLLASHIPKLREQQFIFSPGHNMWLFALIAIVFAPIIEELWFRGFEFSILGRRFGVVAGALISSITFGLAHGQINVALVTFVMGLYLCFVYRKTGSLLPSMALHALNNTLAVASLLLLK